MSSLKPNGWLLSGVVSLALLSGFLVGMSTSPVAGVAVTALLGTGLAALGVVRGEDLAKKLDANLEATKKITPGQVDPQLGGLVDDLRQHFLAWPTVVGKVLTLFSACLLLGVCVGAGARLSRLGLPAPAAQRFPWKPDSRPSTVRDALDWVLVQEHLRSRGYTQAQVEALYELQVADWKKAGQTGALNLFDSGSPLSQLFGPLPPKKDNGDRIIAKTDPPVPKGRA